MKKLPTVASFKRSIVITDATLHNLFDDGKMTPLEVIRHGIRGTQNIPNDKKDEATQIQQTDTAKLHQDAKAMRVKFALRFLPLSQSLDACTDNDKKEDLAQEFRGSIEDFLSKASSSAGLREVALRYARNIANARWLWRNRTLADSVIVNVKVDNNLHLSFSALDLSLNNFDNYTEDEKKLGEKIMHTLGGSDSLSIDVYADVYFGILGAIEVFPSQNYIDGKPKGFSRSLYKHNMVKATSDKDNNVVGLAAMRDQKIGNALRTIDTWYPGAAENKGVPIAIEPNGASLSKNKFFRKNAASAFNIFLNLGKVSPDTNEGMFSLAILMRGGVFSGGSDKDKGTENKSDESIPATDKI